MTKGDIKLLITGVVSLFLAMVMAVITIVVFAFGLGGKIKNVDWNKTFGEFGKKIELARLFGAILGSYIFSEGIRADLIVPVPLSEERLAERGFNQAYEIAFPVSKIAGIPLADGCLIRTRDTGRQSEIKDINRRAVNVRGAFDAGSNWDVEGLTVIVVDDVATTGATLHEAAKVLYKAGAAKVLCIAFAGNRTLKNAEPF